MIKVVEAVVHGVRKFFPVVAVCALCFLWNNAAKAQSSKNISGKITDADTGEPLPYVTVYVKLANHTTKATNTDFSGMFHIAAPPTAGDSVYATYVGYKPTKKLLPKSSPVIVNFQMAADNQLLNTVTITPKSYINPAWAIMDNIVKHKNDNNLEKLKSFEYESYNRLQLSVSNISDKMRQRKVMKQILPLMDSLKKMAGDDGKPILPVFMSETVSDYYFQNSPEQKTEHVKRTKVSGVGIEDETLISQIVGTSFQQYNFYKNYLRVAGKDFISPMTDSWKLFYNYELSDEHDKVNGRDCYKIEFKPNMKEMIFEENGKKFTFLKN